MTGPARPWRPIAIALLSLILVRDARAACGSTDACLRAVEAAQRDLATFTARVVQAKQLGLIEEPLVSEGRLAFKRPDRILWEIDQPEPVRIVIDGDGLHVPGLSDDERRALERASAGQLVRQLGAIFAGDVAALRGGFEASATEGGGAIVVELVPRDDSLRTAIAKMELRFARPELLVRSIRLENSLGDRLEIRLEDVERNADVPDSAFSVEDGLP